MTISWVLAIVINMWRGRDEMRDWRLPFTCNVSYDVRSFQYVEVWKSWNCLRYKFCNFMEIVRSQLYFDISDLESHNDNDFSCFYFFEMMIFSFICWGDHNGHPISLTINHSLFIPRCWRFCWQGNIYNPGFSSLV